MERPPHALVGRQHRPQVPVCEEDEVRGRGVPVIAPAVRLHQHMWPVGLACADTSANSVIDFDCLGCRYAAKTLAFGIPPEHGVPACLVQYHQRPPAPRSARACWDRDVTQNGSSGWRASCRRMRIALNSHVLPDLSGPAEVITGLNAHMPLISPGTCHKHMQQWMVTCLRQ